MTEDIRWKQRFQNFEGAYRLLNQALSGEIDELSDLEKEGVIQRFEYTFELAWKTLRDYLENSGLVIAPVTPRNVIKEALAAKFLSDGQTWIDMLDHRNLLSHTYDQAEFERAIVALDSVYFPALKSLYKQLKEASA